MNFLCASLQKTDEAAERLLPCPCVDVDTLRSARFGNGKAEGGGGPIRFVALALAMGKRRVVDGRYAS